MESDIEFIEPLTNNILMQAKYYLEAAGEFYPFGCNIDQDNNLSPMSIYMEEEFPHSADMILEFEIAIKNMLERNIYKAASIGIDVNINPPNSGEIISAIQIRTYTLIETSKA